MNTYEIGTMIKRLMDHLPDQNNGKDWAAAKAELDLASLRGINKVRDDAQKFLRHLYAE